MAAPSSLSTRPREIVPPPSPSARSMEAGLVGMDGYKGRYKIYHRLLSRGENPKGDYTDNNNGESSDGDDKRPLSSDLVPGEAATVAELRKRRGELGHVRRLLEDPPDWLSAQLGKCREDPDRFIKPTCCNVAYEVYRTSSRWEEVKPVLEAHLEASE